MYIQGWAIIQYIVIVIYTIIIVILAECWSLPFSYLKINVLFSDMETWLFLGQSLDKEIYISIQSK